MDDGASILIDFTDGNLKGWEVSALVDPVIQAEWGNYFIGADAPYAHNGVSFRKHIQGIETGELYKFGISLRTRGAGMMGLQVILGGNSPGSHIGLKIEVLRDEVKPWRWHHLRGFVFQREDVENTEVLINTYSMYRLDVENIYMSLVPQDRTSIGEQDLTQGIEPYTKLTMPLQ